MLVWSKRLAVGLLLSFLLLYALFFQQGTAASSSHLKQHTTFLILVNYTGLALWGFVWMIDQARMRNQNVWVWLPPFLLLPLPTLMAFILYVQRRL
jgi:hypothetical protein